MTTKTVLEEIVTVFSGDASALQRACKQVQDAIETTAKTVQSSVSDIYKSLSNAHRNATKFLPFANVRGGILPFANKNRMGGMPNLGGIFSGAQAGLRGIDSYFTPVISGFGKMGMAAKNFFEDHARQIRRFWYDIRMMGHGFRRWFVLPFIGGLTASIYEFANFDDEVRYAMAMFGDSTDAARAQVEGMISGITRSSRSSPMELAQMMKVLASANYDVADAMQVMGFAEKFYVASGMKDASQATELLVGAQSALGLRVKDNVKNLENMRRVGDALVMANKLGIGTIEDFARALVNSAAEFRLSGKSLEENLAVLIAYQNQAKKSAAAGTAATIMIREIMHAAAINQNVWEGILGKEVVYDAKGNLQNLGDVITALSARIKGMSALDQQGLFQRLGLPRRSAQFTKMLVGFGSDIKHFQEQMMMAGGQVEKVWSERMMSLKSTLLQVWHTIEDVGIEIGQLLEPEIRSLTDALKSAVKWWDSLSDGTKRMFIYAGAATVALGALVSVLASLGAVAVIVVANWEAIAVVAGAVAGALGGIVAFLGGGEVLLGIAAVAAAVAGLLYLVFGPDSLYAAWAKVRDILYSVFKIWYQVVSIEIELMMAAVKTVQTFWRVFWQNASGLPQFFNNLGYNIGILAGTVAEIFGALSGWIAKKISHVFTIDFLMAVKAGIEAAAIYFLKFAGWIAKMVWNAMRGNVMGLTGFAEGFGEELTLTMEAWKRAYEGEDIQKVIDDIISNTRGKFRSLTDGIELADPKGVLEQNLVDPLAQAKSNLEDVRAETAKPFNFVFSTQGLEAVRVGTAAAFDAIKSHFEQIDPTMANPQVRSAYSALVGAPDMGGPITAEMSNDLSDQLSDTNSILGDILNELRESRQDSGDSVSVETFGLR
jgi:TP901 family phage tail tape measure protein